VASKGIGDSQVMHLLENHQAGHEVEFFAWSIFGVMVIFAQIAHRQFLKDFLAK